MNKKISEIKHAAALKNTFLILFLIALVILLVILSDSQSIAVKGQIIPVREWLLQKSDNGNISETLYNYQYKLTEIHRIWQQ